MIQGDHGPVAFRNVYVRPLERRRSAGREYASAFTGGRAQQQLLDPSRSPVLAGAMTASRSRRSSSKHRGSHAWTTPHRASGSRPQPGGRRGGRFAGDPLPCRLGPDAGIGAGLRLPLPLVDTRSSNRCRILLGIPAALGTSPARQRARRRASSRRAESRSGTAVSQLVALSGSYPENVTDTSGAEARTPGRTPRRAALLRCLRACHRSPAAGSPMRKSWQTDPAAAMISERLWTRRFERAPGRGRPRARHRGPI